MSIWEDLRALNVSVSDGNCGALDAVACADVFLEQGRADALLVGGAEAMSEALFLAFHRLGALGREARRRRAALLGEGAALLALERAGRARARGATRPRRGRRLRHVVRAARARRRRSSTRPPMRARARDRAAR